MLLVHRQALLKEHVCAHPLAGTIGNRFAYDELAVIFRKVKGQPKPNICNSILLFRHDRHGLMSIIGRERLALYRFAWGFAATTTVLCQHSACSNHSPRLSRRMHAFTQRQIRPYEAISHACWIWPQEAPSPRLLVRIDDRNLGCSSTW